jgi:hypothetical protein
MATIDVPPFGLRLAPRSNRASRRPGLPYTRTGRQAGSSIDLLPRLVLLLSILVALGLAMAPVRILPAVVPASSP